MERIELTAGKRLVAIVAMDDCCGIGKDGGIPWDCPEDRRFFRQQTMGHPLVVGRRTFESWGGRPLEGRPCAVWTRDPASLMLSLWKEPFFASKDLSGLVSWCFGMSDAVYVCGGKSVYDALWGDLTDLILTRVWGEWACDVHLIPDLGPFLLRSERTGRACSVTHWAGVRAFDFSRMLSRILTEE